MSRPAPGNEPSMDDILASIRRIIADDPQGASMDVAETPLDAAPMMPPQAPAIAPDGLPLPDARPATHARPPMGDGLMPQTTQIEDDDILDLVEEAAPVVPTYPAHTLPAEPAPADAAWQAPPPPGETQDHVEDVGDVANIMLPDLGTAPLANGALPEAPEALPHLELPSVDTDVHGDDGDDELIAADPAPVEEWEAASQSLDKPQPAQDVGSGSSVLNRPAPPVAPEPTPLPFEFRSVGADDGDAVAPAPFGSNRLGDLLATTQDASQSTHLDEAQAAEPFDPEIEEIAEDAPPPLVASFHPSDSQTATFGALPAESTDTELTVPSDDAGLSDSADNPAEPQILASMEPATSINTESAPAPANELAESSDLDNPVVADAAVERNNADGPGIPNDPTTAFDENAGGFAPQAGAPDEPPSALPVDAHDFAAAIPVSAIAASAIAASALSAGELAPGSDTLGNEDGAKVTSRTLEDVVIDAMRPLLQQWIDENMPEIADKLLRELAAQDASGQDADS